MKKTVLTFGLISGIMISVLMDGSLLLADKIGSGHSMALGYTIMVASFLLIYFGIRSYRDNTLAGQIFFGRAFACGILITPDGKTYVYGFHRTLGDLYLVEGLK